MISSPRKLPSWEPDPVLNVQSRPCRSRQQVNRVDCIRAGILERVGDFGIDDSRSNLGRAATSTILPHFGAARGFLFYFFGDQISLRRKNFVADTSARHLADSVGDALFAIHQSVQIVGIEH